MQNKQKNAERCTEEGGLSRDLDLVNFLILQVFFGLTYHKWEAEEARKQETSKGVDRK